MNKTIKAINGVHIPQLGFDVYKIPKGEVFEQAVGVANFEIRHLEQLMKYASIPPMVNQVETHPEFPQHELHNYMIRHQIVHEAWGPLGQGNKKLLEHPELTSIALHYKKSVGQVILR